VGYRFPRDEEKGSTSTKEESAKGAKLTQKKDFKNKTKIAKESWENEKENPKKKKNYKAIRGQKHIDTGK